jgi:VanZ family protein
MPVYERISALVSLTLLGLLLLFLIELPTRELSFIVLGSPLSLQLSQRGLTALLLAGMACAGADAVVRLHPASRSARLSNRFLFWILPGLLALLSAFLLPLAPERWLWAGGLAATGLLLSGVILAEYHTTDPVNRHYELARQGLNVVTYAVGLVLFIFIYQTRARSVISATALLIVSSLLALEMLRAPRLPSRQARPDRPGLTWIYASLVGLLIGEAAWALNYWRASGLTAGLLLLLIFYFLTGLAQQRILGRFTWRTLAEYALVTALGTFLTFRFAA